MNSSGVDKKRANGLNNSPQQRIRPVAKDASLSAARFAVCVSIG
jgi:hypothetical protein